MAVLNTPILTRESTEAHALNGHEEATFSTTSSNRCLPLGRSRTFRILFMFSRPAREEPVSTLHQRDTKAALILDEDGRPHHLESNHELLGL